MIESTGNKLSFVIGETPVFPFNIRFFKPEDIKCFIQSDGVERMLDPGDFSIENKAEYDHGANITLLLDPLPVGATLIIVRECKLVQDVSFPINGKFPSKGNENALDKLTMITQQLAEQIERSIKVGVGATDVSPGALLDSIYASGNAAVKAGEAAVKASAEAVEASQTAKNMAEEITKYFGKTAGLPVGFTFASPSAMPPEGAYLLNGQTIADCEALYPKFFEWVTTSPVRRITVDEYEAEIAEYGICNGFVVSGTSVRLPLWKGYQTPLGDSVPVMGNGTALGFDTGNSTMPHVGISAGNGSSGYVSNNAGFYGSGIGSAPSGNSLGTLTSIGVTTDPDKSGIIADTSGYPQDGFHWCIQVFKAATALSEQESVHLASEMQMKAQTDLANVTNPTQGFKDMAIGWGMPDYSAGVDVSATTLLSGYTAPANGTLYIAGTSDASVTGCKVYINGAAVGKMYQTVGFNIMPIPYLLTKGDVLKLDNVYDSDIFFSAYFFPLKGANK